MVSGICSNEGWVMSQVDAARSPHSVTSKVTALRDQSGQYAPVLKLKWSQPPDGKIYRMMWLLTCHPEENIIYQYKTNLYNHNQDKE